MLTYKIMGFGAALFYVVPRIVIWI
jgi:hypothetical protein